MYLQKELVGEVFVLAQTQVLGEGKTIEEAIQDALSKLHVDQSAVDIEVLEKPAKGFFGRRTGKAVVRATLRQPAPKVEQVPREFGLVSIKSGTLEYSAPPTSDGAVPTISFGSDVQVLYHGEPVEKEVKLTEGLEPLEILLPESREPELRYQMVVDTTGTTAQLVWERYPGVEYKLADKAPANQLRLTVAKRETDAPSLRIEDVHQLVQIEGIKYGLQLDGLTEELLRQAKGSFVVARGQDAQPPRQPSIKYVFQEETPAVDEDAIRIDHYAVHGTKGVHAGDVLAVKDPGEPGRPGIDVYGNPIESEPPRQVEIVVGEGAALIDQGLKAVAAVPGLPSLQRGVVRVTNVFELAGDADVSTGNITMDSDIIIHGNVMDNVKVESSSGAIVVHGLVSGGQLSTGGSITVLRNVVRAQINAGGMSVAQMRMLNLLRTIADQLDDLTVAYDAIVSQADNIPFENLIRHLIELKFNSLPKKVSELSGEMEQVLRDAGQHQGQYSALVETIEVCKLLNGSGTLGINDIEELQKLRQSVGERIAELENEKTVEADVKIGYAQNSRIEASGTVEVTGKGFFYSTAIAGKGFRIASGVFRGGQVTVTDGTIMAKELGGPKGIATAAEVLNTGLIQASLVHPNVVVTIGSQSYKFDETTSMVKARIEEGTLTIYSGSHKIHG